MYIIKDAMQPLKVLPALVKALVYLSAPCSLTSSSPYGRRLCLAIFVTVLNLTSVTQNTLDKKGRYTIAYYG